MSSQKPSLPRGTRDFGPREVARRQYISGAIRRTFERFGFAPLETPAFENLSTLTGKYGEEGDQLLYRILNSGDFLSDVSAEDFGGGYKKVSPKVAEKGLRYDLTVPFARYVVQNRHALTLPFRRYQMQPVWRADRPSKGRYREFVQCDADVVGTDSLLCEAEIVLMIHEVMGALGLPYELKFNHRAILDGIAEMAGHPDKTALIATAIDKLDKIGEAGVKEELARKGLDAAAIEKLWKAFNFLDYVVRRQEPDLERTPLSGLEQAINSFEDFTANASNPHFNRGLTEVRNVIAYLRASGYDLHGGHLQLDLTLARGLSYYTGCIFEVKIPGASVGSVSGGGRYDNLTGGFGMPGLSGVGFSFGIDRLYDVIDERNGFPEGLDSVTRVLLVHFEDPASRAAALRLLAQVRAAGISAELYPEPAKLKKQFAYADTKRIPHVIILGPDEVAAGAAKVKTMGTGTEQTMTEAELRRYLLAEDEG